MADPPSPSVVFSSLIHPTDPASHTLEPVPLISAPSVAAPHAQVLLLYNAAGAAALEPEALAASLARVLSGFPHLAGRLRLPPDDPGYPAYTKRFLRPWMEYGVPAPSSSSPPDNEGDGPSRTTGDPGVLLRVERRRAPLASVLPRPTQFERIGDLAPTNDFSLAPALAPNLSPEHTRTDEPLTGVKITQFDDGAAMVIGTPHCLMDAGGLGIFLADWRRIHAACVRGDAPRTGVPTLRSLRRFDWPTLDAMASGDLDAPDADPALVEVEAGLDVLRYDAWARDPAAPPPPPSMDAKPHPSIQEADAARGRWRGEPAPWGTLGTEPARIYSLAFSAAEVEAIRATACTTATVTAHDAFAAHLWRLVARARRQDGDTPLEFTMACDARLRLPSPRPEAPGCFNICLGVRAPASALADPGWAAARIRRAVLGVTWPQSVAAPRVGAWLHKRAHDLDFRREMIVFPGTRGVCTTNWARTELSATDFGGGAPVMVHNLVMAFGGYATILRQAGGGGEGRWYEPGVDVMLWLEESAMDRLVRDPLLRDPLFGGGAADATGHASADPAVSS